MFLNLNFAIITSIAITLFLREVVSSFGLYKKVFKRNKNQN